MLPGTFLWDQLCQRAFGTLTDKTVTGKYVFPPVHTFMLMHGNMHLWVFMCIFLTNVDFKFLPAGW